MGQPVLLPHCSYSRKHLPYIQSKSPFFQFETISLRPITTGPAKEPVPFPLTAPFYILKVCYQVSLKLSLLQADQPQFSQTVLIGKVFHPLDHIKKR